MPIAIVELLAQVPAQPGAPSILELFASSGLMAKSVFALLLALSLGSWSIMLAKVRQFRRAAAQSRRFLDVFRRSARFGEVNTQAESLPASPLVGLFQAGYVEIDTQVKLMRQQSAGADALYRIKSLQSIERSLRRSLGVELQALGRGLSFLATTAAASPFIGLFGTVWGIMVTFSDIGATGSTSIVAVAPGIAEALVNTAAGLAAAIPALMGYNYFTNGLRQFRAEMDDFILDFLNLAERNFT